MEGLDKLMIGIKVFFSVSGLILLLKGHFSKIEKKNEKQVMILVGWTFFVGSIILIIQQLFFVQK